MLQFVQLSYVFLQFAANSLTVSPPLSMTGEQLLPAFMLLATSGIWVDQTNLLKNGRKPTTN